MRMIYATSRIWQRARRALMGFAHERYRPEQHYMRGPGPKCRARGTEGGDTNRDVATRVNDESHRA